MRSHVAGIVLALCFFCVSRAVSLQVVTGELTSVESELAIKGEIALGAKVKACLAPLQLNRMQAYETCCKDSKGASFICPYAQGVCCEGGTCCKNGWTCSRMNGKSTCERVSPMHPKDYQAYPKVYKSAHAPIQCDEDDKDCTKVRPSLGNENSVHAIELAPGSLCACSKGQNLCPCAERPQTKETFWEALGKDPKTKVRPESLQILRYVMDNVATLKMPGVKQELKQIPSDDRTKIIAEMQDIKKKYKLPQTEEEDKDSKEKEAAENDKEADPVARSARYDILEWLEKLDKLQPASDEEKAAEKTKEKHEPVKMEGITEEVKEDDKKEDAALAAANAEKEQQQKEAKDRADATKKPDDSAKGARCEWARPTPECAEGAKDDVPIYMFSKAAKECVQIMSCVGPSPFADLQECKNECEKDSDVPKDQYTVEADSDLKVESPAQEKAEEAREVNHLKVIEAREELKLAAEEILTGKLPDYIRKCKKTGTEGIDDPKAQPTPVRACYNAEEGYQGKYWDVRPFLDRASNELLDSPEGMTLMPDGRIAIAGYGNCKILALDVSHPTPELTQLVNLAEELDLPDADCRPGNIAITPWTDKIVEQEMGGLPNKDGSTVVVTPDNERRAKNHYMFVTETRSGALLRIPLKGCFNNHLCELNTPSVAEAPADDDWETPHPEHVHILNHDRKVTGVAIANNGQVFFSEPANPALIYRVGEKKPAAESPQTSEKKKAKEEEEKETIIVDPENNALPEKCRVPFVKIKCVEGYEQFEEKTSYHYHPASKTCVPDTGCAESHDNFFATEEKCKTYCKVDSAPSTRNPASEVSEICRVPFVKVPCVPKFASMEHQTFFHFDPAKGECVEHQGCAKLPQNFFGSKKDCETKCNLKPTEPEPEAEAGDHAPDAEDHPAEGDEGVGPGTEHLDHTTEAEEGADPEAEEHDFFLQLSESPDLDGEAKDEEEHLQQQEEEQEEARQKEETVREDADHVDNTEENLREEDEKEAEEIDEHAEAVAAGKEEEAEENKALADDVRDAEGHFDGVEDADSSASTVVEEEAKVPARCLHPFKSKQCVAQYADLSKKTFFHYNPTTKSCEKHKGCADSHLNFFATEEVCQVECNLKKRGSKKFPEQGKQEKNMKANLNLLRELIERMQDKMHVNLHKVATLPGSHYSEDLMYVPSLNSIFSLDNRQGGIQAINLNDYAVSSVVPSKDLRLPEAMSPVATSTSGSFWATNNEYMGAKYSKDANPNRFACLDMFTAKGRHIERVELPIDAGNLASVVTLPDGRIIIAVWGWQENHELWMLSRRAPPPHPKGQTPAEAKDNLSAKPEQNSPKTRVKVPDKCMHPFKSIPCAPKYKHMEKQPFFHYDPHSRSCVSANGCAESPLNFFGSKADCMKQCILEPDVGAAIESDRAELPQGEKNQPKEEKPEEEVPDKCLEAYESTPCAEEYKAMSNTVFYHYDAESKTCIGKKGCAKSASNFFATKAICEKECKKQ